MANYSSVSQFGEIYSRFLTILKPIWKLDRLITNREKSDLFLLKLRWWQTRRGWLAKVRLLTSHCWNFQSNKRDCVNFRTIWFGWSGVFPCAWDGMMSYELIQSRRLFIFSAIGAITHAAEDTLSCPDPKHCGLFQDSRTLEMSRWDSGGLSVWRAHFLLGSSRPTSGLDLETLNHGLLVWVSLQI
jgi:hypothetical protein